MLAAAIWGFAFVAQKEGAKYLDPFTFNGFRFLIGATALLPVLIINIRNDINVKSEITFKNIIYCVILGIVIFIASTLQQFGLIFTTAGKAGFITGLYIIIIPFISIILKRTVNIKYWISAIIATFGLYLLSGSKSFSLEIGDLIVLISAFFWAVHILIISWLSPRINALLISCIQFYICAALSLTIGLSIEHFNLSNVYAAIIPLLYGGLMSIGIAFTIQVIAQKKVPPAHASIIMSLETIFAAFGGWLILNERLPINGIIGCILMLVGMIIVQINFKK